MKIPDDVPPTNEEKILAVLREAGKYAIGIADIAARSGVKNVNVYLSYLARRGLIRRTGRGMYSGEPAPAQDDNVTLSTVDEEAEEDIRAAERARICKELAKAVADAVPEDPLAYIQGFRDGANFVSERVLGMLVAEEEKTPA